MRSIILKSNYNKMYKSLSDFEPKTNDPEYFELKKAWDVKDSDIIRGIVERNKTEQVILNIDYFDCVNRAGIDRYDLEDYVCTATLEYIEYLNRYFAVHCKYIWYTEPRDESHKDYFHDTFYFEVLAISNNGTRKSVYNNTILLSAPNAKDKIKEITSNKALMFYARKLIGSNINKSK